MKTVFEMMASVFIKRQIDAKGFMNLGNGDNGKSVLLDYISELIGKPNVSFIPLQDIQNKSFAAASLDGKSANIFPDLEPDELKHTGKIKTILDGEPIQVERKYCQPFNLFPFAKFIFSCNRFPKTFDKSQGFYRRWIIIKWQRNFSNDKERNENLRIELNENQNEKDLVFSNLIYVSRRLNKAGKFSFSKDWKTIRKQWEENADPLSNFIDNYISDSEDFKTKRETYQFYKKTMIEKGEKPLGIGQFGIALSEYFESGFDTTGKTRVWYNIDFKEPVQAEMKEYQE
jgi:putative DNA primase/helicase